MSNIKYIGAALGLGVISYTAYQFLPPEIQSIVHEYSGKANEIVGGLRDAPAIKTLINSSAIITGLIFAGGVLTYPIIGKGVERMRKNNNFLDQVEINVISIDKERNLQCSGVETYSINDLFKDDPNAGKYLKKMSAQAGGHEIIQLGRSIHTPHIIRKFFTQVRPKFGRDTEAAVADVLGEEVHITIWSAKFIKPQVKKGELQTNKLVIIPETIIEACKKYYKDYIKELSLACNGEVGSLERLAGVLSINLPEESSEDYNKILEYIRYIALVIKEQYILDIHKIPSTSFSVRTVK